MAKTYKIRETWLQAAVAKLNPLLKEQNVEMPEKWQVSCGFPKGGQKAIGQCWDPTCTEDGTVHMFICPSLQKATKVLDVLLHEMIHAAVGLECGHKKAFRRVATAIGLEGKMTATFVSEDNPLFARLDEIARAIGPYPHSALTRRRAAARPPAGGWVKLESINDPTYILRISPRALEEHGVPCDFNGDAMVPSE